VLNIRLDVKDATSLGLNTCIVAISCQRLSRIYHNSRIGLGKYLLEMSLPAGSFTGRQLVLILLHADSK
jgi:hypothetical protein